MPIKIFVGRLAEGTKSEDLENLFKKYGSVVECDIISNYGFVHMEEYDEAVKAIDALDGYNVNGSSIHVELSTAKTQGRKRKNFEGGGFAQQGSSFGGGSRFNTFRGSNDAGAGPSYHHNSNVNNNFLRDPFSREHRGSPTGHGHHVLPSIPLEPPPLPREEYASEQVKDLLELYIRDPVAFDQYAKVYYYGERAERLARQNKRAENEFYPSSLSTKR